MCSLYSILESITDDDEKVSQNTISAVYEVVSKALSDSRLSEIYKCEIKDNLVYISYTKSGTPAVWECISYNTDQECIYKGGRIKEDIGSLPISIIKLCRFEKCMLSIRGTSTDLSDLPSYCSKCYLYINFDTKAGLNTLKKYLSDLAKNTKYKDGNCLYIDPVFSNSNLVDVSFLSGIDFSGFRFVRLPFNVDVYTLTDVTAKILVVGTWSEVRPTIQGVTSFRLVYYGDGADWQTEDQSKSIDQIIQANNITSFAVNSSHVQYDMFFVWNSRKGVYNTELKESGSLRVPKVRR